MKNTILTLGILFLVSGCGNAHVNYLAVDSSLQPYLNHFQDMSVAEGNPTIAQDLILTMADSIPEENVLGYCETDGVNTPKVVISNAWWKTLTDYQKEELVFHELGHCLLNRQHRPDQYYNIPYSIMNPYIFSQTTYLANYTQYQFELYHSSDLASALPMKAYGNTYFNPVADTFKPLQPRDYVSVQDSDSLPAPWDPGVGIDPNLPHCSEEHMHVNN